MSEVVLKGVNLTRDFGAFRAVDGVSFEVPDGEVRAIIGPNGAGKSTLFGMLAGRLTPTEGEVFFHGKNITGLKPYQVFHLGIGSTFQVAHIFPQMTVLENVVLPVLARHRKVLYFWRAALSYREATDEAAAIVERVGLAGQLHTSASTLAHGDRKRLEMAIALAGEPKLLLLDEPTAGMSVPERQSTVALLQQIAHELSLTVVFVEHDMDIVFSFADRITVMHQGRIIADGLPVDIRGNEAVRTAYLGKRMIRG
jgi:branched-chain amino acid transport system ATP-binding protein